MGMEAKATDVVVEGCTFRQLGAWGLALTDGPLRTRIAYNNFQLRCRRNLWGILARMQRKGKGNQSQSGARGAPVILMHIS